MNTHTIPLAFTRHVGLHDYNLMSSVSVLCVGVGGAIGVFEDIFASGVNEGAVIDGDYVDDVNIGTTRFTTYEVGQSKAKVAVSHAYGANPSASVLSYSCRDDQLDPRIDDFLWKRATIVWSMTDDLQVQARMNEKAIKYRKPILFGGVAKDSTRFEVGATLPGHKHCFACYPGVAERFETAKSRKSPPASVSSTRSITNKINDVILDITIGLVHHWAGSPLPIARYGAEFAERPMLIGSIDLDWQAGEGQVFGHVGPSDRLFSTRLASAQRPKGWTCPHCKAVH